MRNQYPCKITRSIFLYQIPLFASIAYFLSISYKIAESWNLVLAWNKKFIVYDLYVAGGLCLQSLVLFSMFYSALCVGVPDKLPAEKVKLYYNKEKFRDIYLPQVCKASQGKVISVEIWFFFLPFWWSYLDYKIIEAKLNPVNV